LNYILRRKSYQDIISNKKQQTENGKNEKHIKSPMFGKVLSINVKKDSTVKKGETLLVLEAMKMENNIQAPFDTQIKEINVKEGEQVEDGQILLQTALN
jgi:biotin carboxyl carrier protein